MNVVIVKKFKSKLNEKATNPKLNCGKYEYIKCDI